MFLNKDIIFTTTGSICGYEITDYLGILIEREAVPANIDSLEMLYALDAHCASLSVSMNARAADIRADAVVGVDFRTDVLGDKIVFTMTGNAVRLKPAGNAPEAQPADRAEEFPGAGEAETDEEGMLMEAEAVPENIFVFEDAGIEACPEEISWQCHGCGTENDPQYRYCPRCGEMRRYDWKCDGCGQQNPPEYKFCPGCGKPCGQ